MLCIQLAQNSVYITAGTVVIAGILLLSFKIKVEGGYGNNPDFPAILLNNTFLCSLFFQIDFIPHKLDYFCRPPSALTCRKNFQADKSTFFPPDQFYGIIDPPTGYINDICCFSLPYTDNFIAFFQGIVFECRPSRDNLINNGILPFGLQFGTDSLKRTAEINLEVFVLIRREIACMGVERCCQCIGISLESVFGFLAVQKIQPGCIAFCKGSTNALVTFSGIFQVEPLVFQLFSPQIGKLTQVGRPRIALAIEIKGFWRRKIEMNGIGGYPHIPHFLPGPFKKRVIDSKAGIGFSGK